VKRPWHIWIAFGVCLVVAPGCVESSAPTIRAPGGKSENADRFKGVTEITGAAFDELGKQDFMRANRIEQVKIAPADAEYALVIVMIRPTHMKVAAPDRTFKIRLTPKIAAILKRRQQAAARRRELIAAGELAEGMTAGQLNKLKGRHRKTAYCNCVQRAGLVAYRYDDVTVLVYRGKVESFWKSVPNDKRLAEFTSAKWGDLEYEDDRKPGERVWVGPLRPWPDDRRAGLEQRVAARVVALIKEGRCREGLPLGEVTVHAWRHAYALPPEGTGVHYGIGPIPSRTARAGASQIAKAVQGIRDPQAVSLLLKHEGLLAKHACAAAMAIGLELCKDRNRLDGPALVVRAFNVWRTRQPPANPKKIVYPALPPEASLPAGVWRYRDIISGHDPRALLAAYRAAPPRREPPDMYPFAEWIVEAAGKAGPADKFTRDPAKVARRSPMVMLAALDDPRFWIRRIAATQLSGTSWQFYFRWTDREAVARALAARLTDKHADVRRAAANSLNERARAGRMGHMPNDEYIPPLEAALDKARRDKDPAMVRNCRYALEAIRNRGKQAVSAAK